MISSISFDKYAKLILFSGKLNKYTFRIAKEHESFYKLNMLSKNACSEYKYVKYVKSISFNTMYTFGPGLKIKRPENRTSCFSSETTHVSRIIRKAKPIIRYLK